MDELHWSNAERKIARQVFDAALSSELARILGDFKAKAAAAAEAEDLWAIESWLTRTRRDIDAKYDYRHSELIALFGGLLREGRIDESQLNGLSDEKLSSIRRVASR